MTQEMPKIDLQDEDEFDSIMTFKCKATEKQEFKTVTGRKGASYLRQAMNQITAQLKQETQTVTSQV